MQLIYKAYAAFQQGTSRVYSELAENSSPTVDFSPNRLIADGVMDTRSYSVLIARADIDM